MSECLIHRELHKRWDAIRYTAINIWPLGPAGGLENRNSPGQHLLAQMALGVPAEECVWKDEELKQWMLDNPPEEPVPWLLFEDQMHDLRVWRKGVFTNKELNKHNFKRLERVTFPDTRDHAFWVYSFKARK